MYCCLPALCETRSVLHSSGHSGGECAETGQHGAAPTNVQPPAPAVHEPDAVIPSAYCARLHAHFAPAPAAEHEKLCRHRTSRSSHDKFYNMHSKVQLLLYYHYHNNITIFLLFTIYRAKLSYRF